MRHSVAFVVVIGCGTPSPSPPDSAPNPTLGTSTFGISLDPDVVTVTAPLATVGVMVHVGRNITAPQTMGYPVSLAVTTPTQVIGTFMPYGVDADVNESLLTLTISAPDIRNRDGHRHGLRSPMPVSHRERQLHTAVLQLTAS